MLSSLLLFGQHKRDPPATMTSMQASKPSLTFTTESLGLKTIADTTSLDNPRKPNCVVRRLVASRSPSPALPPLSVLEDQITENSFESESEEEKEDVEEVEEDNGCCWATYGGRRPICRRFPPPIPLLARTGNLTCHMPWFLKRIYKDDGSLVIQQVRVRHHEYFRARRENGRLILQLVELDAQSPLFTSHRAPRCKEEGTPENDILLSQDPSSLSSSPPPTSMEEEDQTDGKNRENINSEVKTAKVTSKEVDVGRICPRLPMSSNTLRSSIMPEQMCSKLCFDQGRTIHQLPMPMVQGY